MNDIEMVSNPQEIGKLSYITKKNEFKAFLGLIKAHKLAIGKRKGYNLLAISKALDLDRKTLKSWLNTPIAQRLIKEEIERETVNDLFDPASMYDPSAYGDNYQSYKEKMELLGDDPQALQWQYKFVNPDEIPKPYRTTEMYDQYPQVYYDNNYEEDGDFPFRYAYTARGGKPYRQMLTDHTLLTL